MKWFPKLTNFGLQISILLRLPLHMRPLPVTITIIIASKIFASHIGVLPICYLRLYARFMKMIIHNIHVYHCSRLLYPHTIKWIARDQTTIYPFQLSYLLRHIRAIHQKLLCAVIVNLIQIIESIVHLPQYLHVLTMFLMQKENIFPPFSYIPV